MRQMMFQYRGRCRSREIVHHATEDMGLELRGTGRGATLSKWEGLSSPGCA